MGLKQGVSKMKQKIKNTKELINKKKSDYYNPTPKKWRKIGDTVQDVAIIASGIVALIASPPAWLPVSIFALGRIGKIITNFAVE